jgi:hypothetical protein
MYDSLRKRLAFLAASTTILSNLLAAGLVTAFVSAGNAALAQAPPPVATAPPAADTNAGDTKATDAKPTVTFGAFVDGYYAWDFDRPATFDRAFTTQPARHAEFNVNLAFVEAKLDAPNVRGRFAMQFGTSVQANYAGEPHIGHVSGPGVSQYIQEAYIGYRIAPTLWVDGGVFFAHTGFEGWISRDNLAYTRSLIAEFSPYYEAGVKLTWTPSPAVTAQFLVLNGWQNISNYNTPPAVGIRVDYVASPLLTLSYDNFFGDVAADNVAAQYRLYHDLIAQVTLSSRWQLAGTFSLGTQSRSAPDGKTATWYGFSVFAKYKVGPRVSVVARVERYSDPDQVIVITGLPDAFRTNGASLGVDVTPIPRLLWRTELRGFRSGAAVWPLHGSGDFGTGDLFAATSLALTF